VSIPQPKDLSSEVPVASRLVAPELETPAGGGSQQPVVVNLQNPKKNVTVKGGLTLVFVPNEEGEDETCMEERRASLMRYRILLAQALQRN